MIQSDQHPTTPLAQLSPLDRLPTLIARLARSGVRLVSVDTPDPVRRLLNRALVPIYVLYAALALLVAPTYAEPWRQFVTVASAAVCLLGLRLNRHDERGAILLAVCCAIALAVLMPPQAYFTPLTTAFSLPGELLIPIIIAALFISPRAGFITCLAMLALVTTNGLYAGMAPASITRFLVLGGSTLLAVTVLLVVGAGKFTEALRRSYESNIELEQRVAARTAELEAANHLLAEAKARIEHTAELRVKEVTEVVHDARNQLAHVRAAATLLASTDRTTPGMTDTARLQCTIDDALRGQQDILDALLEATLLDAGWLTLHRERTSIAELVEMVTRRARPWYEQRGCILLLEQQPGIPPVSCDARRLLRVVQNLLTNALTYTVAFRSTGGVVRVTVAREGCEVVVRVIDNGIGIAPEHLPLVGQRFVRGGQGAGSPEGTGLGLSASIGVVALHGGSLRLLSDGIGHGTVAELRLPFESMT
jgi:signal transduction histidine kinase